MNMNDLMGSKRRFNKTSANDNIGLFSIVRMVDATDVPPDPGGLGIRCDHKRPTLPIGCHDWIDADNRCSCGRSDRPDHLTHFHGIEWTQCLAIYPVIEAMPYGLIIYTQLRDSSVEQDILGLPHTEHSRTIPEMLRLLTEWDYAHRVLGNDETIAVLAHNMIKVLAIPDDVRSWIDNDVPPEKVARFLSGDTNARDRISRPPDIPDHVSQWLYDRIQSCRAFGEFHQESMC